MVDVPNLVSNMRGTPIFGWSIVGCGSKNGSQRDTYLQEIELWGQKLLTFLDAIINIIGETYVII